MTEEKTEAKKESYGRGLHPNSLAALTYRWDTPEKAREAQRNGAKVRSANAALRKELKLSMQMWKEMEGELSKTKVDSVEVLRMLAFKKLEAGDDDGAAELFKSIAEFEKPKLQRVEKKVQEVKADQMSDEELERRLKEIAEKAD